MKAGEVPAHRDQHVRAELLHESDRTRVTRLFLRGGTVIRKEPLGPDTQRRLRHEVAMLERLRGVAGVAQLLDAPRFPGSIVVADVGGTSLAGRAKPLAVDELIGLAVRLAGAVASMHRRGVMHRDITPANIVMSGDGAPCLVDFALATSVAEIGAEFTHHSQIVGTLAYLAPEQTGRTGRSVDQRADLYALGATLYELATGSPPFGSGDPLRLTHDHLARVPVAPAQVNPAVPGPLSAIIVHLLEKEPDHRYQTAEGVLHDLQRLQDAQPDGPAVGVRIGERDFPPRLLAPSRLVGRDDEVAALAAAFEDALAGRCRGLLVSGMPGVGKTALVNELRSVVTGSDGWFVAGKFDQYRRDLEFDGIFQALRALGRLLLAEPEDELAELRERMLAELGPNAGMAAAVLPEFAVLLGVSPEAGDPLTAHVRVQHSAVATLRAVASRKRPVMVFVDDLQWAAPTSVGVIDLVLGEQVEGLLLVGAHRDEVDAAHPLTASLSRWREQPGVTHLHLTNLPGPSLTALVAEILRVDRAAAGALAELLEPHTQGNPYETVELLNTLRHEGILTPTSTGWRWDEAAVRSLLGRAEVAARPVARFAALPASSRAMVEVMACLGGRAELGGLAAATAQSADVVEQLLAPALEEGVLVAETGTQDGVRFGHDRIREAILAELDAQRRRSVHLALARRLAASPDLFAVAAEQYLPVIDAVTDAAERSQVVALLRRAAEQATLVGGYSQVHTLLTGALRVADAGDAAKLLELHTGRHAALYSLGRLEEADEDYRIIERLSTTVMQRIDATCVQVRSLTHRKLYTEAIQLAATALRELGITVPAPDRLPELLERYFEYLYRWLDHSDATDDLARPEITDPTLLAATRLLSAVFPTASFAGDTFMQAWLPMEALRILLDHGTARGVLGPASYSAATAIALRDDYGAAYRASRRIVAMGEACGYEPETSMARVVLSFFSCWFEPLESSVEQAKRAREGLIKAGDLTNAGYTFLHTYGGVLDCLPTLNVYVAEVHDGLAFARRVGIEQMDRWLGACWWLTGALRGENSAASGEAVPIDRYGDDPTARFSAHFARAIAAAIFDDAAILKRRTDAAMQALLLLPGNYVTAVARLLRGLALAAEARAAPADERPGLLAELDDLIRWLAARAADAPDNFGHLLRLLEAERAWAVGDVGAAALAFEAARDEVGSLQRPWHRALITERAARFALALGLQHAGFDLLAQARQMYLAWGATAKVAQLDWAYPVVRPPADATGESLGDQGGDLRRQGSVLTTGTIDLLAILSASQALSSQTTIEGLHGRVVEVLAAMTGATAVQLLLWADDRQDWLLPAPAGGTIPLGRPGGHHDVPMSVLRYAQRIPEPLLVTDAASDDRFARDPYFADVDRCSLLAVPILSRGRLRAMLLLENRLIRGAFSAERLDAVKLIAGQLAVSLDNAQLYAELGASRARIVAAADQARRRIERDLHDGAQQSLVSLALGLRAAQGLAPPGADELTSELDELAAQATAALDELRELARGIHPAVLAEGGLPPALDALAARCTVPVELDVRVARRLPEHIEIAAYYLVAEALTNVAKHAHASIIHVGVDTVDAGDGVLRVIVRDNGRGGADLAGGSGLVGLKDRMEALGGRLWLQTAPGAGTTLRAELPLCPAHTPTVRLETPRR
jgi:predicted ATPase/signal transduction histidine kinase